MIILTTDTITKQFLSIELDHEWEDLALGGTTVVNYLGMLMVSASRRDTALIPRSGYTIQFIKNTNSLHATLSQVALAMQMTFQDVLEDLVRTCLYMDQIPDHIKAALILIKTASNDLLKKLLPYTLRNVDYATSEASTISKPILLRFVQVGKLIDEVVAVLSSTVSGMVSNIDNYYFLSEVEAYAIDVQVQWYLLVELFMKFSDIAELIRKNTKQNFMNPVQQAQDENGFSSEADRMAHIRTLIPSTITLDQLTQFLRMMAHTYVNVSNEYMVTQVTQIGSLLNLQTPLMWTTNHRDLFQKTVAQSVKVARLTLAQRNEFIEADNDRQKEYKDFLLDTVIDF
ncbi:unnamed protein product [Adineta steineri]|uniref:Uncharacterized protein n=1 Tax=Adineta steineri TaxID=433720 RepID=A0A818UDM8_9BILA|nr:unnamed protein product [Adineta steineri]CAF1353266.1 unnamed protein product [Adineta steineri]CAF3696534.1 unnamed protein product [Adineta steineri]CAF4007587.1 unnamed protein product [Adineta steineri]